ncbi:MAG: 4,5-DOPA dioxygenase extradiol [Granulosicoccus sp.]|nr:4,5-DOPA dioxygenase extradiol [Granulosicoccus sp.]
MNIRQSLQTLQSSLATSERMPLVFLGHGSPMNAIEDNQYSENWTALGRSLPRPQAILVVSAHWMTRNTTLVDISAMPRTIHDFRGFPDVLYTQQYPATGAPELATRVVDMLRSHQAQGDETWGLDHGAWSVLTWLYPDADVPVFQLSIDMSKDLDWHLDIGRALSPLRDQGVLILGSGNVVHNLQAMVPGGQPTDWAHEFDQLFASHLTQRNLPALSNRKMLGSLLRIAHPSLDHYLPSLTVAGASDEKDKLTFMNEGIELGTVSMRSFLFHDS